jgi:hypothetical protein
MATVLHSAPASTATSFNPLIFDPVEQPGQVEHPNAREFDSERVTLLCGGIGPSADGVGRTTADKTGLIAGQHFAGAMSVNPIANWRPLPQFCRLGRALPPPRRSAAEDQASVIFFIAIFRFPIG